MDNGTIDMLIATYTITDERKASYAMSNPYYYDQIGFLVQTKSGYKKLSDLNRKTIEFLKAHLLKQLFKNMLQPTILSLIMFQLGSYPELAVSSMLIVLMPSLVTNQSCQVTKVIKPRS